MCVMSLRFGAGLMQNGSKLNRWIDTDSLSRFITLCSIHRFTAFHLVMTSGVMANCVGVHNCW